MSRGYAFYACLLLALPGCSDDETGTAGGVTVTGTAFAFALPGQDYGRIAGEISVLEHDVTTTSESDGTFRLEGLPPNSEATFVLKADGFPEAQTKTFTLGDTDIERVTFQVPDDSLFEALASTVGITADPQRCQIASTVTVVGKSLFDAGAHGEPGATVNISPSIDGDTVGPVYFNDDVIPTPSLTETSTDGGIVYGNVAPGTYTLTASKDGVSFEQIVVECRPGVLVNASPPYGLQALAD